MDLDALSLDELHELRRKLGKAIASYEDRRRREAQAAAEEAAQKHGFSLAQLIGGKRRRSPKSAPAPGQAVRYANPNNPTQTWSGRGRRPSWFLAHLDAGGAKEDLTI